MRFLNKIVFINSAHIPYAEIKLDGNVHFIGTQGVGKSTLLRAILFFYNADKLRLGIPKEKKNFDSFYFPYANSYMVYEVMRENGPYSILAAKSMGRVFFRFIDAPYSKEWFMNERNEVFTEWGRIRERMAPHNISSQVTSYEMYRDIIFGNNRKQEMVSYRKFAIVESAKYQNIPRTIQNVFLNSKLDANFIKETIIRSMNDEDLSIDLDYFRSQIREFEQEYKDISCWSTKNKQGEVVVRKQADSVMTRYRALLYSKREIKENREKLNYAEKTAKERLPLFEEQQTTVTEKLHRLERLLGEEHEKFQKERDKLVGEKGGVDDKLKTIKQKTLDYLHANIEEVSRRIAQEDRLKDDHKRLERLVSDLTHQYNDVLAKYRNLSDGLEADLHAFKNRQDTLLLEKQRVANERREHLLAIRREDEDQIGKLFEERLAHTQTVGRQLRDDLSVGKQQLLKLNYAHPFGREIDHCKDGLSALDQKEKELKLSIRQFHMDCESLRQECSRERKQLEWDVKQQTETVRRQRTEKEQEAEALDQLIEKRKGSLCEWLEQQKPDWQETIGKVADESLILYSQHLNPQLSGSDSDSLFGVRVDLSSVDRSIRTPEMMKQERAELQKNIDGLSRRGAELSDELSRGVSDLEKKYNQRIRKIADEQHMLEAELQQLPTKLKNLKAELTTWQRKEETQIAQEKEQVEQQMNEISARIRQADDELSGLQKEKEKQLKEAQKRYDDQKKGLQKELDLLTRQLKEEADEKKREYDTQKAELHRLEVEELKGKGADTGVIEQYKRQIEAIEKEQAFIGQHRSLVSDYEKDKRELFDREPELRNRKKKIEAQLDDLGEKYQLRKENLRNQQKSIEEELSGLTKALGVIRNDLQTVGSFRTDQKMFCPPDEQTDVQRATQKSCSEHIEELKSLIIEVMKETESFKKAINLFNSNFTSKNTFNFLIHPVDEADYYNFAANLCEFVDNDKISDFRQRISERYTDIIRRISKETGDLTQNESEINKTIQAINKDFVERNFAGVIKLISLRQLPSNDKLMQLLLEIKQFNEDNQFNMGAMDLFSQESRTDTNEKAVRYLLAFMRYLLEDPGRKQLVLSDTFKLEFRVVENDNDTNWVEKIANVGSDGTDILVKAMVNIMLINVFKAKASRKFGEFKIHCMMDEIGKLHPNNVKGILDFANCRNILLINSSPTTYNVEDYRYTYLLNKDKDSNTQVVSLLTNKGG